MNILLITVDTVRVDRLGCYGYACPTPNIDALADDGVLFEQAITNGTYTKSAFPPILSSTYASMYRGPFHSVGSDRPMLAKVLREHGYRTAGFTSNPLLGANVGYDSGFEVFEEPVPEVEAPRWHEWKGVQRLLSSPAANRVLMWMGRNTAPTPVYVDGGKITNLGLGWLHEASEPFFLWLHYMDSHWPYHDPSSLDQPTERARAWRDRRLMWRSKRNVPGEEMLDRLHELYDAAVGRVDEQVGRVLTALSNAGLKDETAVVLVSDHGEAFYEHGRWQHGAVFDFHEEVLRIPLILSAPGLPRKRSVTELVSLMDLPPTLLDLADIETPETMEGRSLLPVIAGQRQQSGTVISEMVDRDWYCVSLRTDRFKYVYDERRSTVRELYDLLEDPEERHDLSGMRPEIESELEAQLQRHLRRIYKDGSRDERGAWNVEEDVVRRLRSLGYLD